MNAVHSATKEIDETIAALKRCPEYRNNDEETIAADLLKRLEEQEKRYVGNTVSDYNRPKA